MATYSGSDKRTQHLFNNTEVMVGATSEDDGSKGLVPAPVVADKDKFLKGDGSWDTPQDTTYSDFTGATSQSDGVHGLVPAPTSADVDKYLKGDGTWDTVSAGSSSLVDLTDTAIISPSDGQVLAYDGNSQKWVNATGGSGNVNDIQSDNVSVVDQNGIAHIDTMTGATDQTNGAKGLVPTPTIADKDKYLKGDGTWGTVSGGSSSLADLTDTNIQSPSDGDSLVYDGTNQKWVNGTGSGSGNVDDVMVNGTSVVDANKVAQVTSYKELTQSEYDALPASKLTDDVLYCIKDDGIIEGEKFAPIIYSLSEREIGVWTDGKPLYQKSYKIDSLPSSAGYVDVPLNMTGITVKRSCGDCYFSDGSTRGLGDFILNFATPTNIDLPSQITYMIIENTSIRLIVARDRSAVSAVVTIQYTKDSDVAGSGTWGTDGIPMIHYDDTERVIGTFFDKTLYQKTFHDYFPTRTLTLTIPFSIQNLGNILRLDGVLMQSNSTTTYQDTQNVLFSVVPPASQSVLTIESALGYGIYDSTGIKLTRSNVNAYGTNPHVFVTVQYTKTA